MLERIPHVMADLRTGLWRDSPVVGRVSAEHEEESQCEGG